MIIRRLGKSHFSVTKEKEEFTFGTFEEARKFLADNGVRDAQGKLSRGNIDMYGDNVLPVSRTGFADMSEEARKILAEKRGAIYPSKKRIDKLADAMLSEYVEPEYDDEFIDLHSRS